MDTKHNKFQEFVWYLPKFFTYVFCIFVAITIISIITIFPIWGHHLQKDFAAYNWLWFLISIILAFLVILIKRKIKVNLKLNLKKCLIISSIILLILQMIVFANMIFVAGWDVQKLFFSSNFDDLYFSQYPNNLFLKGFYCMFSNIFSATNLSQVFINVAQNIFPWSNIANSLTSSNAAEYMTYFLFVFLNCLLINISVIFTTMIVNKYKGHKLAALTYILAFIFIGLNPWILVPYSDTITMFFVTLSIFSYCCINNKSIKWALIIGIAIIAFNIKPTSIFILISILFFEISKFIYNYKKSKINNIKNIIKPAICSVIVIILSISFITFAKTIPSIQIDNNKEYTSTHFLMMGSNPNSQGFYSDEDISISSNCENVIDREKANIETWKNRLSDMGIAGATKLLMQKNMANYSDASFMWKMDAGPGFSVLDIHINPLIENIYDNDGPFMQVIWFCILIGCFLCIFIKNKTPLVNILCLTLLMQSLFLMVFECGARYLIQYLPYFVILSTFGWHNFSAIIYKKIDK